MTQEWPPPRPPVRPKRHPTRFGRRDLVYPPSVVERVLLAHLVATGAYPDCARVRFRWTSQTGEQSFTAPGLRATLIAPPAPEPEDDWGDWGDMSTVVDDPTRGR